MNLAERFAAACTEPSDIRLQVPRLARIVRERNAQHVVELGTRGGVSTVAFLWGLSHTGGALTSCDLDERPDLGGDMPRWAFIRGNDLSLDVLNRMAPADVVFIDTSHLYHQTLEELAAYRKVLRPGGIFLLHDTELPHPAGEDDCIAFPVRKAIERYCAEEKLEWCNWSGSHGLGMIEVP